MNEQFIILAEKLNQVTSIAETITPEVIQQTLEFSFDKSVIGVTILTLLTLVTGVVSYKLFKKNVYEWQPVAVVSFIFSMATLISLLKVYEIYYYPYSWIYSHFVG